MKDSPYESGMTPVGDARGRFSVKFYLVAMVFILFDIEAIFLYPWAVVYRQLKMFAFTEMLLFIVLVLCGFFYIWKKGVLNWAIEDREETERRGRRSVLPELAASKSQFLATEQRFPEAIIEVTQKLNR